MHDAHDNRLEIVILGGFVHVYPPIVNPLWEFFQRYSLPCCRCCAPR
ncbi:MAG: hypothetical protein IT379_22790 [Deltaproteobacteria bacterium]|nr:hypothetical protein [Deltaproteobacteria bacterium]